MTRPPDVAVVGGGPAGAAVAWRLARAGAAVTLVHDGRDRWRPVGQQLAATARPLLDEMGVLDAVAAVSVPVHEARSAWPGPEVVCRPAIMSPFGPPLAVDRPRLDALLRDAAVRAGARPAHGRAEGHRVLIDATGATRAASRTRLSWTRIDRLRCALWKTPAPTPQPWSLVEAAPDGWWYTSPDAADGQLTVMRVGDNPAADTAPPPHTAHRLGRPLPAASEFRVATIGHANPPWSDAIIATGDAAVAVDPLSSSGLDNALRLAAPAADAALGLLDGDTKPARHYAQTVRTMVEEHLANRRHYLTLPGHATPFWVARHKQNEVTF
ncbi:NAD(P)/FAD-dependent oxidoreductase [Actinomadura chibensis]|uniref:FAD-dependent oxidoreductase n=1 Tax=Actinomadura chibensis TaxID=392828 RepID=A0A5D0NIB8_9ACTN|nr:FAD-dependent monooxygenase [Actinomadura chibensis]TYB44170.1 FAD-dependent oxidoreductase [Actinomadura chibensis]